jgi:two-component system, probable response regulator PhcQ
MNELSTATARIVLVEDDVALARSTRRLLSDLGDVNIETYYNVASARKALERHFDVLVSDYNLPDGSGVEVLAAGAASTASAPRILITANTQFDTASKSINEGGAFRVLAKPCSDEVLRATVGHALAMKRQADSRVEEEQALQRHHLEIAAANADLFIDTLSRSREVTAVRHRVVRALSRAVDRRFGSQYVKTTKLAAIARAFAGHLGVYGEDLYTIEAGILLHRVGSISLRDDENPDMIPGFGVELLQELGMPAPIQHVVADVGETFNGAGLHGRQGVQIALGSRILAIVHRYLDRLNGREDRDSHEEVCLELLGAEDLDPELVASFVVERAGTFAVKPLDTLPFIPCLSDS